jgi:3',5'-cyclic AMP phosphodiesterase CpdA
MGHGTVEWRYDQQQVLDAILADLETGLRDGLMPVPDAVVCTGDVANTGALRDRVEYDHAREWLARLRTTSGAKRIFAVPGNHDIQRTAEAQRDAWRLLVRLRAGEESLDDARVFAADVRLLDARLERFDQFCDSLGIPRAPDNLSTWTELVAAGEVGVRLIGLNSSSLCNDDDDRGHLAITEAARTQARRSIGAGEVALILMHHPTSWLAEQPGSTLATTLETDAQIIVLLHGHIHEQRARRTISSRGEELVTMSAGAVHDDHGKAATHAYSVAALRLGMDGTLSLRYWPRHYQEQRFFQDSPRLPDGALWADIPLPRPEPPAPADIDPAEAQSALQLKALGGRRTAYPTDLTLDELRTKGLLVPARLETPGNAAASAASVASLALDAEATLILGPPGSGKTVLAYELAQAVHARGGLPLVVDVRSSAGEATTVGQLMAALGASGGAEPVKPVIVADGLDEALAAGLDAGELARRLRGLTTLAGLVATCREFEYDSALAATGLTQVFASIYRLQPWSVQDEFSDYVRRLHAAGLLAGTELIGVVAADERLIELVARPLHARMLTFVSTDGAAPANWSALYSSYLGKLAQRAVHDAERAGCTLPQPVLDLWRTAAWTLHEAGLAADDVPIDELVARFRRLGLDGGCAWRVLSSIIEADPLADNRGSFVHYSFYEHLVAQQAYVLLANGHAASDPSAPSAAFAIDFTQEIRRHLTALLRRSVLDAHAWPPWLAEAYRQAAGDEPTRRTIRNLIAYVACRLDVPFSLSLRPLLQEEGDKFLRNSLMWALVRGDDRETLTTYVGELEADLDLRSLNRGYLLYYYGDLPRTAPPFFDDNPAVGWSQTRHKVGERFAQPGYADLAPARRVIDLYTFADLARARSQQLSSAESELTMKLLEALPADLPDAPVATLCALLGEVRA